MQPVSFNMHFLIRLKSLKNIYFPIKFIIGDIKVVRQQLKMWKNYICHKLKFSHGMDDFCIDELLRGQYSDIFDFIEKLCIIGEFDVVDLLLDDSKSMINDLYYFK